MSRARVRCALLVASLGMLGDAFAAGVEAWQVDEGTTGMLVEDHRVAVVSLRIEFGAGTYSRKEDLASALELVRDVLANRDLDRGDLKRHGRESGFGWQASQKEPQFVLWQAGMRLLFAEGDPRRREYEKPPQVSADKVALATARDLLIRLPGRAIGFAGDLTLAEARRHAEGLLPALGQAPADLAPVFGAFATGAERPRERVLHLPRLTQVYYAYLRDSLTLTAPEHAACLVANEVLGGHFNSRLMVALRQEGGETYGAGSFDGASIEPGAYALYTFTRTENAKTTEEKFRAVLLKFHAQGIDEAERADAAGYLLGRRAFERESPDRILATALAEKRLGLPPGFFDDAAQKAAAVPLAEVNAFISRFYDPEQFTMLKLEAP